MKKILYLFLLFLAFLMFSSKLSLAASPTPKDDTPTPTNASQEQLDELKEKIASKVAQLKLTEKRGTIGTVLENTNTQITVIDYQDNQRFVDVDELTKFSSPKEDNFGVSDIKEGDVIGILGIYNKQSRRILAREINVITSPKFINGVVYSVNNDDYYLTVATNSQKIVTIDVENITKTFSYDKESGLLKSGFSKIEKDVSILLVGYESKANKDRITAIRIILLPQFPKNPKITIAPEALEKNTDIIPSTGSGKKLTPITSD